MMPCTHCSSMKVMNKFMLAKPVRREPELQ